MKPELHFGDARIVDSGSSVKVWAKAPYAMIKDSGGGAYSYEDVESFFEVSKDKTFKIDIPGESVLHEFRGMQYLGPVERDDGIEKKIKELLFKFQGAIVVVHDCNTVDILHDGKLIAAGCGALVGVIGMRNLEFSSRSDPSRTAYYCVERSVVSLESIRTAKANKEEFLKNYERMMKL